VLAGGKAVPDASVTLLHEESHRQMDFPTEGDGTQRILGLPPGVYHIGVCRLGNVFASAHHRVEGGKAEEVTVELQPGARLEGRVTDAAGRELKGVKVVLLEPVVGAPIEHDLAAQTDSSGQYRIDGIPEGTYDVRYRHDGHRSWAHPRMTVTGSGGIYHVNVVLDEGRRLTGRVLSESGDPVPGATVVGSNGETVTCLSDEEGRFAMQGLGELPVHGFASAPGYGVAFVRGVAPGSADVEFRLPRTASVSGQIEARPLPERFNVQLSRFDPDLAGYFPFYARAFEGSAGQGFQVPEISPGRYRLEIQADGYEAQDLPELSVASGQSLSGLQVRLKKRP
jgi:hypothetical protein